MKAEKIKLLFPAINSKVTGRRNEWVLGHCPMAPFKHKSGKDNHPSFGIKSSEKSKSICKCQSCGYGGDLDDLLIDLRYELKKDPFHADKYDIKAAMQLIALEFEELEFDPNIPDYEDAKRRKTEGPMELIYPDSWLDTFLPWGKFKDARDYISSRAISGELADHMGLRYDPIQRRVCFPFRNFKGRLMGMQGRAIDKSEEKRYHFYDYGGHKNMHVWLGEDSLSFDNPVILVEGPFDRASILRVYPNVAASFSAGISKEKVRRMSDAVEIITFYDYGDGGDAARLRVDEVLKGLPVTHVIPGPDEKDPGDMSEEELVEVLQDCVTLKPFTKK